MNEVKGSARSRGRILLVSYHFGDEGSTGGFRWSAMVRDLVELGWTFDVITNARPGQVTLDVPDAPAALSVELFAVGGSSLPERTLRGMIALAGRCRRVLRPAASAASAAVPSASPTVSLEGVVWRPGMRESPRIRLAKALLGFAAYVTDRIWVARAAKLGGRLVRHRAYVCVVVSSPPHTTQLVGATLARRHHLPFVADFRDPWVAGTGVLKPFINAVTRVTASRDEPRVLRRASLVLFNTEEALRRSEAVFGDLVARRAVVANGYDGDVCDRAPDRDVFRILFAGWLHPYMDAPALIAAAARLRQTTQIAQSRFRLEFLGTGREFGGVPLMEIARACGIETCTVVHDRRTREEAFEFQQRAAVLVAYTCPHGLEIAMKFYDYLQMRGTLLLIGHVTGALAQAASRIGARVVAAEDNAGIDAILLEAYQRWLSGRYDAPHDAAGIFARRHRSREADALLSTFCDRQPGKTMRAAAWTGAVPTRASRGSPFRSVG